jgi:hypothetical protein
VSAAVSDDGIARRFEPWIGPHYLAGGVLPFRLLILGESHYHEDPNCANPRFTSDVVQDYLSGHPRHRFFTSAMQVVSGRTFLRYDLRRQFWESVAFYNYIQHVVGGSSGVRPALHMWRAAQAPFRQLLHEYRPRYVLVCGWTLWSHLAPHLSGLQQQVGLMPTMTTVDDQTNTTTTFAAVPHPASRGFSAGQWHPSFLQVLHDAKP